MTKIPAFTLGISPCPNDTFIFDAMINNRIAMSGISFNVCFEDVETLNKKAMEGALDITKISFAAYPMIADNYQLLTAGSALGNGVGPLLVSKNKFNDVSEIRTVAIPGKNTTANYLFKMFYPSVQSTKEYVFSDIENAVLDGSADAGVIIHENRFTYAAKGLQKISDLGELWEKKTGQPIPLGGIAIRRDLDENLKRRINALVKESVLYAFDNPDAGKEFIRMHAQEMSEEVRMQHINLYVNEFSIDLSANGRQAIESFLGFNTYDGQSIFVN